MIARTAASASAICRRSSTHGIGVGSRIGSHASPRLGKHPRDQSAPTPPAGLRADHKELIGMNEDMKVLIRRRTQAARDQVRIAYGAVPVILEGFPADDPFRASLRNRARALLVEEGDLTAEEFCTLPVADAISTTLRRFRDEVSHLDRSRTPRPGTRSAGVTVRSA